MWDSSSFQVRMNTTSLSVAARLHVLGVEVSSWSRLAELQALMCPMLWVMLAMTYYT